MAQERIDEKLTGCYLVDVRIETGNRIVIELDHEERGASIEECMQVSRNVEHNLDREVEDFELEVSSAGLDRPLKVWKQYLKNVGRELKVVLEDGAAYKGILQHAENEELTLRVVRREKVEGKKKKQEIAEDVFIPLSQIKEAKVIISFK